MGSRNLRFEEEKTVKKQVKKKVPAKRRSAGPTKAAPFRLEVGKTYVSRDGRWKAKIFFNDGMQNWPFRGKWIGKNPDSDENIDYATSPMWNEDGGIFLRGIKRPTDLVREVPAPKPPKKARKA